MSIKSPRHVVGNALALYFFAELKVSGLRRHHMKVSAGQNALINGPQPAIDDADMLFAETLEWQL
ncbi:MAG: hypothetical protein AAGA88_07875 [Pseudomonadota bacterium]